MRGPIVLRRRAPAACRYEDEAAMSRQLLPFPRNSTARRGPCSTRRVLNISRQAEQQESTKGGLDLTLAKCDHVISKRDPGEG
jgi:hypothetical protein